MRSSFVPKLQPKITEISALEVYYFKVNTKRESMFFLQADITYFYHLEFQTWKIDGNRKYEIVNLKPLSVDT